MCTVFQNLIRNGSQFHEYIDKKQKPITKNQILGSILNNFPC